MLVNHPQSRNVHYGMANSHQLPCVFDLFLGKELQFLLSHSGEKVFEVLRFKEEPRSWFVEDSVQRGM